MRKPKLTIKEQVENLKGKGIVFTSMSEDEVAVYLTDSTTYYALKAYAKLFKEEDGKYSNLSIEQLIELSKLDWYLRKTLLTLTISIEHFLKVNLNTAISEDPSDNGYRLVREFLDSNPVARKKLRESYERALKSKKATGYQYRMLQHLQLDSIPIWQYTELCDFNELIELYLLYLKRHKKKALHNKLNTVLWSVKSVRNAAAHNMCLLNSLSHESSQKDLPFINILTNDLNIPLSKGERSILTSSQLAHDIVSVAIAMTTVISSDAVYEHEKGELLYYLKQTAIRKGELFLNNQCIFEAYHTTTDICEKVFRIRPNNITDSATLDSLQ